MFTKELFEQALGIQSPWYVKSLDFNIKEEKLDVHLDFVKGTEFAYKDAEKEVEICKAHDTINKTWRHLNLSQYKCYIHARVPRLRTSKGVRLYKTPWEGKMNGLTLLFEALALQLCVNMPVIKVSEAVNINDDKLWLMIRRYVTDAIDQMSMEEQQQIGLNETSVAKGHDYITLLSKLLKQEPEGAKILKTRRP